VGLVDVLEGQVPWQRALVDTEIANLSVMPTGTTEDVPLDMLGTVEMHDLLGELSEKFDRVILDGPAILGLADARAVGRFVDGVLLVMRANSYDSRPLARIRELFVQEGLQPAGIVFNGLREHHEDLADHMGSGRRMKDVRRANRPERMAETNLEVQTPQAASVDAA
jgi:Mrp family chromosome partitioning ATPase